MANDGQDAERKRAPRFHRLFRVLSHPFWARFLGLVDKTQHLQRAITGRTQGMTFRMSPAKKAIRSSNGRAAVEFPATGPCTGIVADEGDAALRGVGGDEEGR